MELQALARICANGIIHHAARKIISLETCSQAVIVQIRQIPTAEAGRHFAAHALR
jgi:hypothetical protein